MKDDRDSAMATSLSLLERARRHDPAAWDRICALYRPLVLYWCRRGGLEGPDAEDVSQEVFAAVAAALEKFHRDQPGDTFRGWLRGITRNQILLYYRKNQRHPRGQGGADGWDRLQEIPDPLGALDEEENTEVGKVYYRALDQLREEFEERTWQAFCRTVIDGRSPALLVDELGMTAMAIRQAKARVLRRLKQEVGDLIQ